VAELAICTIIRTYGHPFLKRGFYGKPIGMWDPNPNYGGPWLWRAVTNGGSVNSRIKNLQPHTFGKPKPT